jgi:hypothetical protein
MKSDRHILKRLFLTGLQNVLAHTQSGLAFCILQSGFGRRHILQIVLGLPLKVYKLDPTTTVGINQVEPTTQLKLPSIDNSRCLTAKRCEGTSCALIVNPIVWFCNITLRP